MSTDRPQKETKEELDEFKKLMGIPEKKLINNVDKVIKVLRDNYGEGEDCEDCDDIKNCDWCYKTVATAINKIYEDRIKGCDCAGTIKDLEGDLELEKSIVVMRDNEIADLKAEVESQCEWIDTLLQTIDEIDGR